MVEMELQLGLALPTTPVPVPVPVPFKLLDLNNSYAGSDPPSKDKESLLKLGQCDSIVNTSSSSSSSSSCSTTTDHHTRKRRRFHHDIIDQIDNRAAGFSSTSASVPKTLPLLLWANHPNDEDEDDGPNKHLHDNSSSAMFKNDEEGLVGWPPVKTWRKKLRRQMPANIARQQNNRAAVDNINVCGGGAGRASNSTYVKVKMEGVGIARKIDLSLHHSFDTLTPTLLTMFGICGDDENRKSFKLTYQDREGDWLLAQDVSWRTFIRSLKCLKLIRSRAA